MRRYVLRAAWLAALAMSLGRADEGRIPIVGPISITVPGHYIVTRDFAFGPGNGIDIQTSNVTLDLNGHTITGLPGAGIAVHIDTQSATQGIVIRNGRLLDGTFGVYADPDNRVSVRIEGVEIAGFSDGGIRIEAAEFAEVRRCHLHDDAGSSSIGISIDGGGGIFQGIVSDNKVERAKGSGIELIGLQAGQVVKNSVEDCGSAAGLHSGILLSAGASIAGAGGNLVIDNTLSFAAGDVEDDGIQATDVSPRNLILKNVIRGGGLHGIHSFADGTRIERNVVGSGFAQGIRVGSGSTGAFNHLEENQAAGNNVDGRCGILFDNGAGHVYRNNNLRNHFPGKAVCGPPNTDGLGNIL